MKLIEYFIPPLCVICAKPITGDADMLCPQCRVDFEQAKERCRHEHSGIAVKIYTEYNSERAGSAIHLAEYDPNRPDSVINRLIMRLKYTADHRVAKLCAKELAAHIRASEAIPKGATPVIAWIPRRIGSVLFYGRDHMQRVAKALSRELAIPSCRLFSRSIGARDQKYLDRNGRKENARRSIRIAKKAELNGKTVVLIDDIITTGASMEACARLLIKGGARSVIGVSIAATERHDKPKALSEAFLIKNASRGIK